MEQIVVDILVAKYSKNCYISLMSSLRNLIPTSWQQLLEIELQQPYFDAVEKFITNLDQEDIIYYPPKNKIFQALSILDPRDVKVVIIGQDPYHGKDQAMGLSFSVPLGQKIPPSLRNIFRELMNDEGINYPGHGDLTKWANQGVLLLNAILTVETKKPGSHAKIGWMQFTDSIITQLSSTQANIVFMLWGNFAQAKKSLIDHKKHLILEAAHPSPLARNKFQGCAHFSKANEYLRSQKRETIDWQIDDFGLIN